MMTDLSELSLCLERDPFDLRVDCDAGQMHEASHQLLAVCG